MHNRWQLFLLVLTGFLLLMLAPPIISQARDVIEATGNDVNSAVIKDSKGNVISHEAQLPENDNYTVNYKWRIPNSVKITAGDTMTFHVPENVQIPTNEAFPMIGTIAGTIGNFFIAAGSHTGIVTFNKVYQYSTNRSGYVNLDVKGTMPSHPGNQVPISLTKYAAWENEADPSHINWTVHVSSNGNQLVDPTFADTLGIGQTFVTGSAVLHDANGNSIPVITTATSNQLSFSATGTYTSSLTLTYKTEISHSADTTTFTNNVDYTDNNNNQGSATANISRPETTAPETPSVTNPENPDEDETPNVTEPEQPSHPEPEQPSTTIPEQPSTTTPEQPSHPEPEQPGTTTPEQPSHPEPEQPGTTTPEQPSHPEPEQPSTTTPGMSAKANCPNTNVATPFYRTPLSSTSAALTIHPGICLSAANALILPDFERAQNHNLPQTNEYSSKWQLLFGLVLLGVTIGFAFIYWQRQYHQS